MISLPDLLARVEAAEGPKLCEQCGGAFVRPGNICNSQWEARRFCSRRCLLVRNNERRSVMPAEALLRESSRDPATGCLVWTGAINTSGYGRITNGGVGHKAHRLSYRTWVGPIPDGLLVCHRCDNRLCIEPTHLFLGSNSANIADRNAKGRQARGESGGRAKLTEAGVRAIRASGAPHSVLAAQYRVGETAISNVRNRRSWAHVAD